MPLKRANASVMFLGGVTSSFAQAGVKEGVAAHHRRTSCALSRCYVHNCRPPMTVPLFVERNRGAAVRLIWA